MAQWLKKKIRLPMQERWVQSLGREDPLEKWQPTPVFLPREFHGQRSLLGYNPRGHKELDTTERLTHTQINAPRLLGAQKESVKGQSVS